MGTQVGGDIADSQRPLGIWVIAVRFAHGTQFLLERSAPAAMLLEKLVAIEQLETIENEQSIALQHG